MSRIFNMIFKKEFYDYKKWNHNKHLYIYNNYEYSKLFWKFKLIDILTVFLNL